MCKASKAALSSLHTAPWLTNGVPSSSPEFLPCMMMNHVKQNEYANLLGAGPTSMEAEANKWILNKKTAQAMQLLLLSPSPPLGLHPPLGVHSEGLREAGSRGPDRQQVRSRPGEGFASPISSLWPLLLALQVV